MSTLMLSDGDKENGNVFCIFLREALINAKMRRTFTRCPSEAIRMIKAARLLRFKHTAKKMIQRF